MSQQHGTYGGTEKSSGAGVVLREQDQGWYNSEA